MYWIGIFVVGAVFVAPVLAGMLAVAFLRPTFKATLLVAITAVVGFTFLAAGISGNPILTPSEDGEGGTAYAAGYIAGQVVAIGLFAALLATAWYAPFASRRWFGAAHADRHAVQSTDTTPTTNSRPRRPIAPAIVGAAILLVVGSVGVLAASLAGEPERDAQQGMSEHELDAFLMRHVQAAQGRVANSSMRYEQALEDLGLFALFDPSHIDRPERVEEAHQIIQQARELAKRHQEEVQQIQQQMVDEVLEAPLPESVREQFLAGFEANQELMHRAGQAVHEYELEILDALDEQIQIIGQEMGRFDVRAGVVLFDSDEAVDAFQRALERMWIAMEEQEELELAIRRQMLDYTAHLEAVQRGERPERPAPPDLNFTD